MSKPTFHITLEAAGLPPDVLTDSRCVERMCREIAKAAGLTILGDIEHRTFEPDGQRHTHRGLTSVAILSESHIAYHSEAEHGAFYLDVFTCGDEIPLGAIREVVRSSFSGDALMTTRAFERRIPTLPLLKDD